MRALSWYPEVTAGSGTLHQELHNLLSNKGVPFHGSKFTGTVDDFWRLAEEAYDGIDKKGYLKIPYTKDKNLIENLTPKEAIQKLKEMYENGEVN